ncbi:unnamed protein product [Rotaria sordida]|uniref:Uncharacterized protein n=1 Tax=Rotaria sordida TaxID=392033 RepID=A0A818MNR3_9BILA|nr:unnamed protein product [Rotaria sordida]CAF1022175.1 unnamed protein product [Rotaria sordida]CAF1169634.1 unnamed protein product [Rotaria sordida]CAF1175076.1 unnamed protein product [Rotaria sordida]CAF1246250.1 unnamed protein product [Rotaria sordida]
MVSLFNFGLLGFFLFFIIVVQAKPLSESKNNSDNNKSTINYEQLYDLYRRMRLDPRLASVSNYDILLFITRNFIHNRPTNINSFNQKYSDQERYRQQNNKLI